MIGSEIIAIFYNLYTFELDRYPNFMYAFKLYFFEVINKSNKTYDRNKNVQLPIVNNTLEKNKI